MRDSDWRIIYELHQNPSITKVSGLLYKSQSAITKRLQSMEGKLDAAFIRSDYTAGVYHELVDHTAAYCVTRDPVDLDALPSMEQVAYQTNQKTIGKIEAWWMERYGTTLPEPAEDAGYIEFAFRSIAAGNRYLLCFLPDNFVNEFQLTLTPLLAKDGKQITRDSWFIYKKEKNRRAVVDELIQYVEKHVKIRG